MRITQSPLPSPKSNQYSNPNDQPYNPNQPLNFIEKPPNIKKTFSELNQKNSNYSSINSQNHYNRSTKIPKVILDEIASKTRQHNENRIRESFQLTKKRFTLSKRKSSSYNKSQAQEIFQDQADQNESQKLHPTGNIRKSLATNKFSKINQLLSSRNATCPICMVQGNNKEFISIDNSSCNHKYCRSCMHQYVIFKIKMFEKVTCPDDGCDTNMKPTSQIYAQLPLDTRKQFKKIAQYNEVLQDKTKRICPNQNCQGVLDISNPSTNPRCPKCTIVYCRKCYFRNHAGQCTSHQLQFFSQTLNYRQCYRCQNMIEKNYGCNHMTCRCGYQFCYLCGQKWKSSHNCEGLGDQPWVRNTWECCCFQCIECQFCDSLDYCCECVCFDAWECCEFRPIRYLSKFIIILLLLALGLPLWITYMVISSLTRLVMGVLMGLIVIPFSLISSEYDHGAWILLAVIFFPITIPGLIFYGIKMLFEEEQADIMDELFLPCEVINEIIQL